MPHPLQRILAVPGFPDDIHQRYSLEQGADPRAHQRVIIRQQHSVPRFHLAATSFGSRKGSHASMRLPEPSSARTENFPPPPRTRSAIPIRPRCSP